MKTKLLVSFVAAAALIAVSAYAADPAPKGEQKKAAKNPIVEMKTSLGTIKIEVFADKTPGTAENFLKYVDDKFYDGTIFHRVIKGFVIQGGGMNDKMSEKPTRNPIKNEAMAELKNLKGTLSMARTPDPNSATSQFFINLVDNRSLDFRDPSPRGIGYAVFGRVVEGMDVVEKIGAVQTGSSGMHQDVPQKPVYIESARRAK